MLPGPPRFIACPHCSVPAYFMTLISGNTFGAVLWTDGKLVAPRLPIPPLVVECGSCGGCYWRTDARRAPGRRPRRFDGGRIDPALAAARPIVQPSEAAYLRALEQGLASNPEQLRSLRALAWWRGNDPAREVQGPRRAEAARMPEASRENVEARRRNLEALASLLNERTQKHRLVKAEIHRELGDIGSALRLLERVTASRCLDVVRQLRALCEAGDTCVRPLRLDD